MPKRIPEDTKQRAVRLVLDHVDEYPNLTVACQTVAGSLGFGAESLQRPVELAQFTSVAFAETLALEGIAASIGSIGDAYDNALAESTIGLFKNEAIRDDSPFRTGPLRRLEDVEWVTMAWVDWYNQHRLHSRIGYVSPEQYETAYYADITTPSPPVLAHT